MIDISKDVKALCQSLNVDYDRVKEITLQPGVATVTIFKLHLGNRYVDPTTKKPAVDIHVLEVFS